MSWPVHTSWTEERIARMKELVEQAFSAGQIARELGGVSRNAVLGKLFRLGITSKFHQTSSNGTPKQTRRYRKYQMKSKADKTAAIKLELEPEPVPNPTALFDLRNDQCRWPVLGEGHQTLFCGALTLGKHSYCAHHCRRAFSYLPALTRAQLEIHQRKLANKYRTAA